jgi:N-acyl-D-amino-acid deacylase
MRPEARRSVAAGAAALAALLLGACGPAEDAPRYDVLIRGGTVLDGSGGAPVTADVGIVDGRIATVAAPAGAVAERLIDASGLLVVPGFIDPHTHALDDLLDPERAVNANYLAQGVTTVFVGNDGGGVPDRDAALARMREHGIGTDVAFHAGHNRIRRAVLGLADRAPEPGELEAMKAEVRAAMEAGAVGLSTGLFYMPGTFATTDEVVELAREAAAYGGVYDSHLRDEASYGAGLLAAVEEAIEIGRRAGLPVHIAHLKALGRDVWGRSTDVIAAVEAARAEGQQVTADQYPYVASGTSLASSLIPRWAMADSVQAMFERIADRETGERIREEMAANLWRRGGPQSLLITGESRWQGRTLLEIAGSLETDPLSAAIEVVRDGNPSVASFNMNPDDLVAFAVQPWVFTGSDGSTGHPRKYATYPTAYREYVLERELFPVEVFVARSSGRVADAFGLCDRGRLEPGRRADVVVIDPQAYEPVADFEDPTRLARGVRHVLVAGVEALRDGAPTGARPGAVVDARALTCETPGAP